MELTIKNEKLTQLLDDGYRRAKMIRSEVAAGEASTTRIKPTAEDILFGYLSTMLGCCEQKEIALDFTYDTIGNLTDALTAMFDHQMLSRLYGQDMARNRMTVAKSAAAYLTYVAMNEHGCELKSKDHINKVKKQKMSADDLWAGHYEIAVGLGDRFADLLPACAKAVANEPSSEYNIHLDAGIIAEAYAGLTGYDLTELGFKGFEA